MVVDEKRNRLLEIKAVRRFSNAKELVDMLNSPTKLRGKEDELLGKGFHQARRTTAIN